MSDEAEIAITQLIKMFVVTPMGSIKISHDVFEREENSSRNKPVADYSLAPSKAWNATNMLLNNI